ncbi:MAG: hypothetical protein QXT27_00580 [Pyrobaculum sp.]
MGTSLFLYNPWYQLFNRTVVFGGSGVYIDLPEGAEVGVKEEVLGPVLSRCSYVVNASLNPAELRLGEPLYNTTGRYFRIG